jgi:hypothetical protein
MQRIDQYRSVRSIRLLNDPSGDSKRSDRKDRKELQHDDRAGIYSAITQGTEPFGNGGRLCRSTGDQYVAGADLGSCVDDCLAGIDLATEDHRFDVERDQTGCVEAAGNLPGACRTPRIGVVPDADRAETGVGGDPDSLWRL